MSTRKLNIAVTALLTGLLSATDLHAAPIVGVTASTSIPAGGGSDISHIVDGSGLFDGTTLLPSYTTGALHGRAAADSTFVSGGAVPVTSGSITFDLGRLYVLDGMAVWNFNGGDNTVGVKDLSVLGSTDGVNFTPIGGAPNHFAIGANGAAELAELFSFSSSASFVRFDISSTYGNFDLGLSEVMFTGTPLPEPSSLVLLASGMAMLVLVRRALPARSAQLCVLKIHGQEARLAGEPARERDLAAPERPELVEEDPRVPASEHLTEMRLLGRGKNPA